MIRKINDKNRYLEILSHLKLNPKSYLEDLLISEQEFLLNDYYFAVGEEASRNIIEEIANV